MIRLLPFVVELALLVYCLIDCIQTPETDVRNLPKWGWVLLIVFFPLVGGIAWLVAGRPVRARSGTWRYGAGFPEHERPPADTRDIDQRLQADLARADREHEQALRAWAADLERREREAQERARRDRDEESPST